MAPNQAIASSPKFASALSPRGRDHRGEPARVGHDARTADLPAESPRTHGGVADTCNPALSGALVASAETEFGRRPDLPEFGAATRTVGRDIGRRFTAPSAIMPGPGPNGARIGPKARVTPAHSGVLVRKGASNATTHGSGESADHLRGCVPGHPAASRPAVRQAVGHRDLGFVKQVRRGREFDVAQAQLLGPPADAQAPTCQPPPRS